MVQAGLVGVSYLDQYIELYIFLGIVSSGEFHIILNHFSVCNSGLFILITSKNFNVEFQKSSSAINRERFGIFYLKLF